MPVIALNPEYGAPAADTEDKFHGNRLLYVGWQQHLLFCSPICLPLPPTMPFGAFVSEVLPGLYASHPDFASVDWSRVEWTESGRPFKPDADKSLANNGLVHKSLLQFRTPGLNGIGASGS